MSKYYRHEDIVDMIEQGFSIDTDGDKAYVIYELLPSLPTIEVSEDAVSKEYVLDKLNEQYKVNRFEEHNDTANIGISQAESIVEDAPSVVPKEGIEE